MFYQSARYVDFEYDDETSAFDPNGEWQSGSEYYKRTYRCRVPRGLLMKAQASNDYSRLMVWIDEHADKAIWLS